MTSFQFLEQKLRKLFGQFPKASIRYELRKDRMSHIVEVTPLKFYNDDEYILAEIEIEDEFELLFPTENIIFISEDSLNKVTNPILEWIEESKTELCMITVGPEFSTIVLEDIFFQMSVEDNYALAA